MIRAATPDDVPAIAALIRALAEYERLSHEVALDEARLRDHLFGPHRYADALVAGDGGAIAGFALFFHTYSTFLARPGIWLEDLFVLPEHRRRGHGRALLAAVARIAVERGCARIEWSVLDWNEPAIAFYRALGAQPMSDWTTNRLTGAELEQLGTRA